MRCAACPLLFLFQHVSPDHRSFWLFVAATGPMAVSGIIGALWVPSRYGNRYRCGIVREGGRTLVITAGLGTSMVPLRIGAPPDIWLVTLGPRRN